MYRLYSYSASLRCSFVVGNHVTRMSTSQFSYEDAINKLNALQSNKSTLEQIRRELKNGKKCTNLHDMEKYLARTGVSLRRLDQLSVVHVAGTKGKGSTSAMCESILRHHGYKTGFYSSPHLVVVRERIRMDGQVISEEMFTKHFKQVYDMLENSKAFKGDMPKYFAFLTVLAFNIFLKEKVDVAIIEVGIGGIVDYTNILRNVQVVGITALGLDHTSILGTTLPQIAAAKAGIMKKGCQAYTVQQPVEAMEVLTKTASDLKCSLHVVPSYDKYTFPKGHKTDMPYNLEAYQTNASLAIQLACAWMQTSHHSRRNTQRKAIEENGIKIYDIIETDTQYGTEYNTVEVVNNMELTIPEKTALGLRNCRWPGRYQVIDMPYGKFYLDGAHTKESIEICAKWFNENSRHQDRILIFSATGDRDSEILLKPLKGIIFKMVFFVIPTAFRETKKNNDNYSILEEDELLTRCQKHARVWENLNGYTTKTVILNCVSDALKSIELTNNINREYSILITGSLHLVGAALTILDPNLCNK